MNLELAAESETGIKRVGKSGQISLGKEHAGQYFREHRQDDGAIVLIPVVVVPKSHWTVRDTDKIRKAIDWAAKNPAKESDPAALVARPLKRSKRGR